MRLNFSYSTPEEINEGISRLSRVSETPYLIKFHFING